MLGSCPPCPWGDCGGHCSVPSMMLGSRLGLYAGNQAALGHTSLVSTPMCQPTQTGWGTLAKSPSSTSGFHAVPLLEPVALFLLGAL